MSGNPFRRARGARIPDGKDEGDRESNSGATRISTSNTFSSKRKAKKVVTIQTPPQSPEEGPRRLSAGRVSPPPPARIAEDDSEETDSTATADSDLEQAVRNTRRNSGPLVAPSILSAGPAGGAPYNPFARTLATSEAAFGLQREDAAPRESDNAGTRSNGVGRPMMDVDQFKDILLNGSAAPSPPASSTHDTNEYMSRFPQSSTNGISSSESRQSHFDPYLEASADTPRASFDAMGYPSDSSDGDDEESSGLMTSNERLDDFAPPAPPKPSLGRPVMPRGPQTVSFADFDESIPDHASFGGSSLTGASTTLRPPALKRSPSDLNKPLPPPPIVPKPAEPARFDLTPPTPQDVATTDAKTESGMETKKALPPPPPSSRRAGQPSSSAVRARGSSDASQNSVHEDVASPLPKAEHATTKAAIPPPPPPSRKVKPTPPTETPTAAATVSSPPPSDSKPTLPPPGPPPRRMASKAGNSVNRNSSTASRSSMQRKDSNNAIPSASAPPAPPPRRGAGGNRHSMDLPRRLSEGDSRRGSETISEETSNVMDPPTGETAGSVNILDDMTAFQREIDALRAQAERPG